jgi:hypothetical protein
MKHLFTLILFIVLSPCLTNAQVETGGTGTGTQSYGANSWANTLVSYTGTGDTRSTTVSTGYTNASGGKNVFLTSNGSSTLIISNITVSSGAIVGELCFGVFKSTNAEDGSSLQITYTNATGPSSISLPTGGGTSNWTYRCVTLSFSASPITVTFTNTSTSNQFRLDDIGLTNTVLPVEFSNFNVSKNKNTSSLSFATASETNNNFFSVERSADGTSFDAIGEIKGAGNSNTTLDYEFTDKKPFAGVNYYRIKQTDYDGKFSYTDIKSVRHNTFGNLSITPRTTEGRLQITTDAEDYTLDVYNVAGQQVKSYQSLSLDQSISIDELTAGLYYIKVNVGGQVETTKIVKL